MVKNNPHSLKLILLLHSDIGLGKFTWTKNFLAPVAPVIEFSKTKSWLFVDFGHHGGNDQLKKEPLTSPTAVHCICSIEILNNSGKMAKIIDFAT